MKQLQAPNNVHAVRADAYARGNAAFQAGRWNEAIQAYSEVLNLGEDPNTLTNLGMIYQQNWQLGAAVDCYERALALQPAHVEALSNYANALQDLLQPERGLTLKRRALLAMQEQGYRPSDIQRAAAEFVFTCTTLLGYEGYTEEMRRFCRDWLPGIRYLRGASRVAPAVPADRKIRLGYLSADFNHHTVMVLLEPLFERYNRERFELYLYSNGEKPDDRTQQLAALAHVWRPIAGLPDYKVARLMQMDKLDLLVDLSGYSSGHRLKLLAGKPAPRIATGLGFIAPIGHPAIDYAILDESMVSEAQTAAGVVPEQIVRIPTNMFYRPDPVLDLEKPERSGVVFGSANSLFKVNQTVIKTWATILKYVPGSVLSLKAKSFTDPSVLQIVRARFQAEGIEPTRIQGSGQASRREFMQWYHGVDIALDPFPYQGGVTTSEALYMGCPVIALDAGGINTTTSILRAADLADYLTNTPEAYAIRAIELGLLVSGLNPDKRLQLRQHIRQQIEQSIIFDADHFVRSLEAAYEQICAQPVNGGKEG